MFFTQFFPNIWELLIEKSYFIPDESSIFTFKATKMNDGSGDWWLYGEDEVYYYALNIENETPKYFKVKKNKLESFDPLRYSTWKKQK
ncbi:hypothetical protein A6B44_00810 [Pasteurella skyensis]|nr:hypothetical protein A6B44_00810 [Pasteurella skyensis]